MFATPAYFASKKLSEEFHFFFLVAWINTSIKWLEFICILFRSSAKWRRTKSYRFKQASTESSEFEAGILGITHREIVRIIGVVAVKAIATEEERKD